MQLQSPQAATALKHQIEQLFKDQAHTKKPTAIFNPPHHNPFKTLPKDVPARDKNRNDQRSSGFNNRGGGNFGRFNNRGSFNRGGFNNRGGGMGYQNPGANMGGQMGGYNQGAMQNFGGNPMMGGGNNFGGGFNRGAGMMGGGMRGGMNNRGGRGGMGMNMQMPMGGNMMMGGGMMGGGMNMPMMNGMGAFETVPTTKQYADSHQEAPDSAANHNSTRASSPTSSSNKAATRTLVLMEQSDHDRSRAFWGVEKSRQGEVFRLKILVKEVIILILRSCCSNGV